MLLNKFKAPSDDPGGEHYSEEVNFHYWLRKRNDVKAIKKALDNIAVSNSPLVDDSVIRENTYDSAAYSDNSMIVHADHSYASYSIHIDHDYHKILDGNEGIENNFLNSSRENLCVLKTRSNCADSVVEREKQWLKINIEHQYTKSLLKNNNSINKRKFSRKLLHPLLGLRSNQLCNKKFANYSKNSVRGNKKTNGKISKIISRSRNIRKIKNKYKLVKNYKVDKFRKKFFDKKSDLVSMLSVDERRNVDCSNKGIFEKESIPNRNGSIDIQPSDCIDNIKLNSIKENNENYLSTNQLNAANNDVHLTLKNTNKLLTPSLSNKLIENSFNVISPKKRITLSNIFLDHSYTSQPENITFTSPLMEDNSDKNDYGDVSNISSIIDIERLYKILNKNCMMSSNFKPFVVKAKNHRFLFQKYKSSTNKDASPSLTNNTDPNLPCSRFSTGNDNSMRKSNSGFSANNSDKIQSTDNFCGYKRKSNSSPEINIITKKLKSVSSSQTQKCLSDKKNIVFTADENISVGYLPNVVSDSNKNCSTAGKNSLNSNVGNDSKIVIENVISLVSANNDNYIESPPRNINSCELKQALTKNNAVSKILKPVINYHMFSSSGSRENSREVDQEKNLLTDKNASVGCKIRVRRDIFKSVTESVSKDSFPTISGIAEDQTEEIKLAERDEEGSLYCSEHFIDDEETLSCPENSNDGNISIVEPRNFYGLLTSESKDLETEQSSLILDRAVEQRYNHSSRIRLEHNYNEVVNSQNPSTLNVTCNVEYSKNDDTPFKRHKKDIFNLGVPLHNENLNYSGRKNLKSSVSEHLSKKLNDVCPFDCFVKLERIDFYNKLNFVNDSINRKSLKSTVSQSAVSSTNNPSSSVKKSNISKAFPKQIFCRDKKENQHTNNGKYLLHFDKNLNSYEYKSHGSSNECKMKPTCQQSCAVNRSKESGETTSDSSRIAQINKHTENMKSFSLNSKMEQYCVNNPAVVLLKHQTDTLKIEDVPMKRSMGAMTDFELVTPNSVIISPSSNVKKSCLMSHDRTDNFNNLTNEIKLCSVRVNRCDISKYGCLCSSQMQDNGNSEMDIDVSGKIIDVKNQKHSCVSPCNSSRCMLKQVHSSGTVVSASEAEMKINGALSNEDPAFERINVSRFSKNECSSILRSLLTHTIATQCDEHDIKVLLDRARRYDCVKTKTLSDPKAVTNLKSAAKVKRKNPEVRLSDIYKQLQFLSYFNLKLCTSADIQKKKGGIKNRLCTVNKNYKV